MSRQALIITALLVGATAGAAQTPAPRRPAVRGYVFDSLLTLAPLPNAQVFLNGPVNRIAKADPRGRFFIDSLTAGKYTISFTHPSLEAIGYAPAERPIEVGPTTLRLFLSTPAGSSVYERLCPEPREQETGLVLGTLVNVVNDAPVAGAEVRADWTEDIVSRDLGYNRRNRYAKSVTDSLGRYVLCGVPTDIGVLLRARHQGSDGAPLELKLEGKPLAVRPLSVFLGDSSARAAAATAILKGTVLREDSTPLVEAQVLLLGTDYTTRTGGSGNFELVGLPSGTHTIEVRAIGHRRQRDFVDLRPGRTVDLRFVLSKLAVELPEIAVVGKANASGLTGFDERKLRSTGHFITQDEIERRGSIKTEDLFRTVPGLRVLPSGPFDLAVVSSRGGGGFSGQCTPDFFIDGTRIPMDPSFGGLPVNPSEIYGIEVYQGAGNAPVEFFSTSNCGVVLIWTKRGGRARRD